jgi:hypothetical protein
MLFWKEHGREQKCLKCGKSRYVELVNEDGEKVVTKVAHKQLRYMLIFAFNVLIFALNMLIFANLHRLRPKRVVVGLIPHQVLYLLSPSSRS